MNFRPSLLLLMCLSWHWCYAAANKVDKADKQDNSPRTAAADGGQGRQQPPSLELLEFLGGWQDGNGEWVDPAEFADDSFEQLTSTKSGKHNE